uniref:Uncharacterized protein n=1 Tax=Trachysalambria curvirostris majanivirus TaxID=2984281 RepID=A0A9C7F8A7_9VIRU|nr:MAG: hypothetical protein [Trachysalambria curvirostris majanivirus]
METKWSYYVCAHRMNETKKMPEMDIEQGAYSVNDETGASALMPDLDEGLHALNINFDKNDPIKDAYFLRPLKIKKTIKHHNPTSMKPPTSSIEKTHGYYSNSYYLITYKEENRHALKVMTENDEKNFVMNFYSPRNRNREANQITCQLSISNIINTIMYLEHENDNKKRYRYDTLEHDTLCFECLEI